MNNYLMNNNLTKNERIFLDGDDDLRLVKGGLSGNMQDENILPQMYTKIKEDLEEISKKFSNYYAYR